MSIVEQAVDSIKTESSIKELCASHDEMIKIVRRELPKEMELDIIETEKTETKTNGSASKLKDAINETSSSLKSPLETVQLANNDAPDVPVEQMDVDKPSNENGNGITNDDDKQPSKNNGETDVISGECKTGEENKIETEEKSDEKANNIGDESETQKNIVHPDNSKCETEENKNETDKSKDSNCETEENKSDAGKCKEEVKPVDAEMPQTNGTTAEVGNVKSDIDGEKKVDGCNAQNDSEMKQAKDDEISISKSIGKETSDVKAVNEAKEPEADKEKAKDKHDKLIEADDVGKKTETAKDIKKSENADSTEKCVDKTDASGEHPPAAKKAKLDVQAKDVEDRNTIKDVTEKEVSKENIKCKETIGEPVSMTEDPNDSKMEESSSEKNKDEEKKAQSTEDNDNQAAQTNGVTELDETQTTATEKVLKQQSSFAEEDASILKEETCEQVETSNHAPLKVEDQEMVETNENENVEQKEKLDSQSGAQNQASGDHEMAEVPEKETTEQDEAVTEDEPVSQTMYVDENRYFESVAMLELSRMAWTSTGDKQQYIRGCLWSPDGTCLLTAVNMDGMHVINLPTDLYSNELATDDRPVDKLESVIHVKEGGTVYDYCWYPFMNSTLPESCCWISSRQHCPIQLWDGFTGELRGSYRGYDNVDEVEAAISVTFTSDAEKIVGGYKKTIKIFDTKSPGREYIVIPTKQPCSCFAVQETQSNIIATGSWNSTINLYDLRTPKLGSLVNLEEHSGGVTFLKFTASADLLFSGARKDNSLLEWDMRNFSRPLRKLYRTVTTNQRIYFDLSPGEKWLASGDTEGLVRVWDLKSKDTEEAYSFELHKNCCNGISFHPSRPMMATCSGQYHFAEDVDDHEPQQQPETVYENSLIFWWIGEMSKDKGAVDDPIPMGDAEVNAEADKMEA